MIKVLIVDDQMIVCEGLEMILSSDHSIEVVGIANNGLEAIEKTKTLSPDLIMMDLKMPIMNGIRATEEIKKDNKEIKIIVLTTFSDDEWVFEAIRSGANGYLLKGTAREDLIEAVKNTYFGKTYIDPEIGDKIFQQVSQGDPIHTPTLETELSQRELEVLHLLAKGFTNNEIADQLFLSNGTVRNYISTILNKLQVDNRTQAALKAVKYGLGK
jgi:DNA-binding NarL/FixJ family response regulator